MKHLQHLVLSTGSQVDCRAMPSHATQIDGPRIFGVEKYHDKDETSMTCILLQGHVWAVSGRNYERPQPIAKLGNRWANGVNRATHLLDGAQA